MEAYAERLIDGSSCARPRSCWHGALKVERNSQICKMAVDCRTLAAFLRQDGTAWKKVTENGDTAERGMANKGEWGKNTTSDCPHILSLLADSQKSTAIEDKKRTMIDALKHWKPFLYGREFTVKTDHRALKWLQTMPSADWSDRQARWSQIFQQYGGMIEYLPRKHNPIADALSRKSSLVQAIQLATILEIQGLDLDCMKGEYPYSVEFSTPFNLAMAALVSCATAISLVHIIPVLLHVKVRELFLRNKAEELNREMDLIRRQEEAGRHVRMLTQEIRRSLDRHTILAIMLEELGKTLHLENCTIWMPDYQRTALELTHELKRRSLLVHTPVLVPANDELVKAVQTSTKAIAVATDSILGMVSSHDAALLGPMVAVRLPLLWCSNFKGGTPQRLDTLYAVMVLGLPKGTGREWGPSELEIVETVSDQMAVAQSWKSRTAFRIS
ncbi:hypothetical protein L7F22_040082 [Adiantum nelumboides]|nr:hypothetical protein [Adiantum nelumboides]